MEEFKKSGATSNGLASVQNINTSLNQFEGNTNNKAVFKNVVSNQKDITIDLSVFLEDHETRKFFKSDDEETKNE